MGKAFQHREKVLFRHCDPAGIVFYPRYFEMINDAVEAWFSDYLGAPFEDIHGTGGVPTAETRVRFVAPSRHGDRLILEIRPKNIGRASLTIIMTARCNDELRFEGQSTLVCVNTQGRPKSWPDTIRKKIVAQIGDRDGS